MPFSALATIYVCDLDRAVRFYVDTLGMTLVFRAGPHIAQLRAGDMTIMLHPSGPKSPKPGTNGSITIGLKSSAEPLEALVTRLSAAGVRFPKPILDDRQVRLAFFLDPDGNELYFAEPMGGPR